LKDKSPYLIFIFVFILVLAAIGVLESLPKRPQAIHLWSQADRASVARNYAQDDMNFFRPSVHYTKQDNGVTGMEFPMMNYIAAVCYKIFGFNEFWYRFSMLIVVASGVFAAFVFSLKILQNTYLASFVVLLWFLSPVLDYYTPNFIPDAASLGFILIAWLFWFRYSGKPGIGSLFLFTLFASFAALIKITSLISVITIMAIAFLDFIKFFKTKDKAGLTKTIALFASCLFVFLPVYLWYHYASQLNEINRHGIFTLDYHPVTSFAEFKDIIKSIYHQWFYSYYSPLFYLILLVSAVYIALNFRKADQRLLTITVLLYLGNLFFLILMFKQFRDHDYYIITLLPAPLFQLITAAKIIPGSFFKSSFIRIFIFGFCIAFSLYYARADNHKRYSGWQYDKKWDYSAFYGMDHYLNTLGITKDDKVMVIYDGSFDISLYLMNVKGWTMWPGNNEALYLHEAIDHHLKYIILRNPEFVANAGTDSKYFNHKIGDYNGIGVYQIQ
jgi:hypothetical protein